MWLRKAADQGIWAGDEGIPKKASRDLPQYDSASYCKTVNSILTALSEDYREAIKSCMEKEQRKR